MLKVLLVEDEDIIRRGLQFQVDWTEVNCVVAGEAATGQEGLRQIELLHPDVVITDIRMPDMDGLEMLKQGRKICPFSAIIISGYGEFEYAQQAIHLGVVEYLLKPVDISQLKNCLRTIDRGKQNRQSAQPALFADAPELWDGTPRNKYVSIMLQYIREHYSEPISLTDLSQELNISCTHLNAKFKGETGYTFHNFLNEYRIRKAVELQQDGNNKLYEIAEMVGFSDYKYFSRVFKKYTGYAPNTIYPQNTPGGTREP